MKLSLVSVFLKEDADRWGLDSGSCQPTPGGRGSVGTRFLLERRLTSQLVCVQPPPVCVQPPSVSRISRPSTKKLEKVTRIFDIYHMSRILSPSIGRFFLVTRYSSTAMRKRPLQQITNPAKACPIALLFAPPPTCRNGAHAFSSLARKARTLHCCRAPSASTTSGSKASSTSRSRKLRARSRFSFFTLVAG